MHFKTSSGISFSLDQSKILSSGNGLIINYRIPVINEQKYQEDELMGKV